MNETRHQGNPAPLAYLQHGQAPGPMRTEAVQQRETGLHSYEVFYLGKWRKVLTKGDRTYIKQGDIKIDVNITE